MALGGDGSVRRVGTGHARPEVSADQHAAATQGVALRECRFSYTAGALPSGKFRCPSRHKRSLSYCQAFTAGDREGMLALLTDDMAHDLNQGAREVGCDAFLTRLASAMCCRVVHSSRCATAALRA